MNPLELSAEQIDALTIAAVNTIALDIEDIETRLTEPNDQIEYCITLTHGGLLDAGCGSARYVDRFVKAGIEYRGCDISDKMLAVARRRHPMLQFDRASIRSLPYSDEEFDTVWCAYAIDHIEKRSIPEVLLEFKRVLVRGGYLLVSVPYCYRESEEYVSDYLDIGPMYFSIWEHDEFVEVLKTAGFNLHFSTEQTRGNAMFFVGRKP